MQDVRVNSSATLSFFFFFNFWPYLNFSGGSDDKNLPAVQETQVPSLGQKTPWRREWLPIPVFLPGDFHGQWSLAGYSPWGSKKSDMTERLTVSLHFTVAWGTSVP